MYFSIIIPVFNRPDEIEELLASLVTQTYAKPFEIIIVEDGSSLTCESVQSKFSSTLTIRYFYKANSGPGDSRNFGMQQARGNYFIIFDSDCIIPSEYLLEVEKALNQKYVDCFGGPDKALDSFSSIQKAINFSMTSFLTTGGIRGGSEKLNKFQPRSFNMGISKKAFEASGGFGLIHPGEDPDLSIRLWNLGFETALIKQAFVYHKRRIDWTKFYKQVYKFGKVRPILSQWHPATNKITFFFPTLFILALDIAIIALLFGIYFPIFCFFAYFLLLFLLSTLQNKSLKIGALTLVATFIQFYGYGVGFLLSYVVVTLFKKDPEVEFPELFFKKERK
ncbi:glycosyltransferase [Flavobacterium sp.]|uniref:glycosyltransferase n=1 Tax=Flavobacterium sp. TaxID=239 RepID=UPI002636E623|nr:glycosyltransferase [Flavobacterium sp.]MDD2986745.1 glycosyltransferase [Flavobacterium sp.]